MLRIGKIRRKELNMNIRKLNSKINKQINKLSKINKKHNSKQIMTHNLILLKSKIQKMIYDLIKIKINMFFIQTILFNFKLVLITA